MRNPLDAYRRWRHGRGFGVHSPWAFRVITEALRGHHAYYDDAAIDRLFGREAHTARQVYRVLALDDCKVTRIIGGDERWQKLVSMASPRGKRPTLLVIGDCVTDTVPIDTERVVVVSRDTTGWIEHIMVSSPRCLVVTNHKTLAVANLKDAANKQIIEAKY